MRNKLWNGIVGGVLGGALIAGAMGATSCDDNNNSAAAGGRGGSSSFAGHGGSGGIVGTGGKGGNGGTGGVGIDGGANTMVFNVQLDGSKAVPSNNSTATGTAIVTLDRTTGAVNVAGSFMNLSSSATGAAIHGPAGSTTNAAVVVSLTVPNTTSGTVSGTGTMTGTQMTDMTGGMTYISITTVNFPDGEIRAQIKQ
jgi:hypothetical protein